MGGKQKQAQRVKNNARPSNSGRSAEFLGSTNAPNMPTFSFSTMKEAGFTAAAFSMVPIDDIDSSVDANFQLVLKKMNKKDATTKLKALQEFTELLKHTECEAVKAILPFWPRLYCALATDTEHKVREASHVAHNQVVLKAKRNLAPYLKQLIGPWFTSQYDTYAPAASAAGRSFKDAFPVNKMQEAIVFCQEEILNYVCDNLTVHTVQTLSNPKTCTEDESKGKYERVLISSLQGYSLYLRQVPEEAIKKVAELHRKIISNGKFWKLARNEMVQIRASWFAVLSVLCERTRFLLEGEEGNVVKAVFGNLDESDPVVQANLWEAALLTSKMIDDWWKFYNIESKLLPKLWKVLREAGNGNATVIYPNLLPLISHLPSSSNNEVFLPKFFDNMRSGLQQISAKTSNSESRAISVAFIECLQYSIMKNHQQLDLCQKLIRDHLMLLLDGCLLDSRAAHKTLFNQVSALVQYWHKNSSEIVNYGTYLGMFWAECDKLFTSRINEFATRETSAACDLAARQINLLVSLKHDVKAKQSKVRVQFSTEDDDHRKSGEPRGLKSHNLDQTYLDALHRLVFNVCVCYIKTVEYTAAEKNPAMIENVVALAQDFESEEFVRHLQQEFCPNKNSLFDLVFNWIRKPDLCRQSVVDLIFLLLKYTRDEDETNAVLLKIFDVAKDDALGWCISRALSHPHNTHKTVQNWLGHQKIGEFLVKLTRYEIEDKTTSDFSCLLKQAFTETQNGELFISKTVIDEIIGELCECLLHPMDHQLTIDSCASLAAYISSSCPYSKNLFLALFTLSCTMTKDDWEFLSKDTLWEVKTAWQDAIGVIAAKESKETLVSWTRECSLVLCDDGNCDVITSYLLAIEKSRALFVGEAFKIFFDRPAIEQWRMDVYNLRERLEYFKGFVYLQEEKEFGRLTSEGEFHKYFMWKFILLKTLFTKLNNEDDEEIEEDEDEEDESKYLFNLVDHSEELLTDLINDYTTLNLLTQYHTHLQYHENLKEVQWNFIQKLLQFLREVDTPTIQTVENILQSNLKSSAAKWARATYIYHKDIKMESSLSKIYTSLIKDLDNNARMQLTLAFSENQALSFDDIQHNVSIPEAIINLTCLAHCEDIDVQIAEVHHALVKQHLTADLNNWDRMNLITITARMLESLLCSQGTLHTMRTVWDFIVVHLSSWSGHLIALPETNQPEFEAFAAAIAQLYIAVEEYILKYGKDQSLSAIVDEWKNVFVESVSADLVNTWLCYSEMLQDLQKVPQHQLPFLQDFGRVIQHLHPSHIFDCRIVGMPKWSALLKQCCRLLTSKIHVVQLWAYHMLKVLAIGLMQVDSMAVASNTPHEKGLIFEQFKEILVDTHMIVSTMLLDFKLGEDSCVVKPFTDSYTFTFAYLLLWDFLLHLCEKSSTELRYQYSDWLKQEELLNSLLSSIFKLMPVEVFHSESRSHCNNFTNKSQLPMDEPITSGKIERLNCAVYAATVAQLPAAVRQWWSNAETRTSQLVERVTASYVSPYLCAQELADVLEHENKFKNLIIKVHPSVKEVVAIYTVDEAQMELIITLPANYPLGGPDVQCNRQIGGLPHKQWLMQLRMCVLHQNGRIWDALSLWNNNLDKKFDGVEECYICFAVLHPGTYQLPKLSCKTCRKKFHAACLYKWFSTSNRSTCPICRNLF